MNFKLAALASGRGSNFEALARAIQTREIPNAQIECLISNNPKAPALQKAVRLGIPARVVDSSCYRSGGRPDRQAYEEEVLRVLAEFSPDLICLAGYLLVVGNTILEKWGGKIINIHPALLPSFKGLNAQHQALEYGVRVTGCTVHFVTDALDGGPIIVQKVLTVREDDTEESLSARLLPVEHQAYLEAVKRLCTQNYRIVGRRIIWGS